jgi:ribosomal protein S18 acetylase RimI-like enzyme
VLPPDRLAALFREAGIDSARPVVTTCGSGITAFGARLRALPRRKPRCGGLRRLVVGMGPARRRHAGRDRPVSRIAIRAFAENDRAAVVALWSAAFGNYTDAPGPQIDVCLAHPDAALFVARAADDTLAGTAMAGSDGHRGWLHYVAVDPARRREGIARALVAHAERWLMLRGISKVNLQIRDDNLDVRAFYEKLGYAAEERLSLGKRLLPPAARPPAPLAPGEPGTLEVVITHLEMTAPPAGPAARAPALKLAVLRAERIALPFYRFLYAEIGRDWIWHVRRPHEMTDAALAAALHDDAVDVFVLYASGQPGGFVELDRRRHPAEIEIRYIGLMPWLIGRGAGPFLLDWAVREAWRHGPGRLAVNTCNLDHPRALAMYQRAGFAPVRQETRVELDPRPLA